MKRSLQLKKETLAELTSAELDQVVGASGAVCVSAAGGTCLCPTFVCPTYTCVWPESLVTCP